jgi:hypothetical protein
MPPVAPEFRMALLELLRQYQGDEALDVLREGFGCWRAPLVAPSEAREPTTTNGTSTPISAAPQGRAGRASREAEARGAQPSMPDSTAPDRGPGWAPPSRPVPTSRQSIRRPLGQI